MKLRFNYFDAIVLKLLVLSVIFLTNSCNVKDQNKSETVLKPQFIDSERIFKKRILQGDTIAYTRLRDYYIENNRPTDFLIWALIMSNKYKFEQAYYDVFFCIQETNTYYGKYSIEKREYSNLIDSITNEFSKSYLFKMSDTAFIKKTIISYFKD